MGIKEKELEELILNLLDSSAAVQRKIRSICAGGQDSSPAAAPNPEQFNNTKTGFFDKKKTASLEAATEQLKNQLAQCRNESQQTAAELQKYKNYSAQLQSKCRESETQKNRLENTIAHLENELKKVNTALENSENSLKEQQRESARLKETEQTLSSKLAKADDTIRILKEKFYIKNPENSQIS